MTDRINTSNHKGTAAGGGSSNSNNLVATTAMLPPIPNLSPALEATRSQQISRQVQQDSLNLSQSLPLDSLLGESERLRASLQLSTTGLSAALSIGPAIKSADEIGIEREGRRTGGGSGSASASYSHRDLRFESDADVASSSFSMSSTSGFNQMKKNSENTRAHSGGSGGTTHSAGGSAGAKRGAWRSSQKGDSCSLSSKNSEDDDGFDELMMNPDNSSGASNTLPSSFLSSASLPLTPFKNQVMIYIILSPILKYLMSFTGIGRLEGMLPFSASRKRHFVNRWTVVKSRFMSKFLLNFLKCSLLSLLI